MFTGRDVKQTLLLAWVTLLIGSLLWPLAQTGDLLLRDMAVISSPTLHLNNLGFGDLPARNAPQDGVLAMLGFLPVDWIVRLLLVVAAYIGAFGASRLGRAQFLAVTIAIYNPFVIERLLQGHWSLVIAAWLLPAIVAAKNHPRWQILAMWAGSLTPTGAVVSAATALTTTKRPKLIGLFALLSFLPWLIPALIMRPTSGAATLFFVRAEHGVGTVGTVLGLGGIWNAAAVPASREAGFAVFGVVLFFLLGVGFHNCPRPLLILGAMGILACLSSWLFPTQFSWLMSHITGAGLFRDSQKLLMFAIPAYVCCAAGVTKLVELISVVVAVAQVPDAARAVAVLRPEFAQVEVVKEVAQGRDVLIVDRPSIIRRSDGLPVVDPLSKAVALVQSGELIVDGVVADAASPRWLAAQDAHKRGDYGALEALNIGVLIDENRTVETNAGPQRGWRFYLGASLTLLWMFIPVGLVFGGSRRRWARPK